MFAADVAQRHDQSHLLSHHIQKPLPALATLLAQVTLTPTPGHPLHKRDQEEEFPSWQAESTSIIQDICRICGNLLVSTAAYGDVSGISLSPSILNIGMLCLQRFSQILCMPGNPAASTWVCVNNLASLVIGWRKRQKCRLCRAAVHAGRLCSSGD